jgi:DNA-binding transcriptional LysR family regulator
MLTRGMSYVDAIARAGSVRKAAERLNVAASAVNRQLLDLEAELGVDLAW